MHVKKTIAMCDNMIKRKMWNVYYYCDISSIKNVSMRNRVKRLRDKLEKFAERNKDGRENV